MTNTEDEKLDEDVSDVLRAAYREQMDTHAQEAEEVRHLGAALERAEARQKTAAERATSLMETLTRSAAHGAER